MTTRYPTRIKHILHSEKTPGSTDLWSHLARLQSLNRALRDALPAPMAEHCQVANLRGHQLILAADSSVWATRVRYHTPQLLSHFRQLGSVEIDKVRVHIRTETSRNDPPQRRQASISASAGTILEQTARGIGDAGLESALLRLAARAGREKP